MEHEALPQLDVYKRHYIATVEWLLRSMRRGRGGSRAYFSLAGGWSAAYPETTGYLIPTLLTAAERINRPEAREAAHSCGVWLLSIQRSDGAWFGGLHPPRRNARPSVFNTAQILTGLLALHRATGEPQWLDAARRGAHWLAGQVDERGEWPGSDYRAASMMSYYAHAAWPLVETGVVAGDAAARDAGTRVLRSILARRDPDGSFRSWGFEDGRPAFTHTIAYTLWGLLAAAEALGRWNEFAPAVLPALDRLARSAERAGGALPGAFGAGWKPSERFVCLTGNAQIALCLLAVERREPDLRWVNAACKLVDFVCARQRLRAFVGGRRGAVGGSSPIWGPYMRLRYPNWAAKYHADALAALGGRLARETS